jgi:sugar transferase (PEP-CTERM/EpsH1 system associated)
VLETLAAEHELTLLSFIESAAEREHLARLEPLCRRLEVIEKSPAASMLTVVANCWRRQPLQTLYYRSRAMKRLVSAALAETSFDAAYVHLFRMAPYLAPGAVPHRIVDLTDVISSEIEGSLAYRSAASRLLYSFERRRIEVCEERLAMEGDEVWLISPAEGHELLGRCPGAELRVVPNGVDCEAFRPLDGEEDPLTICFTGHMGVFHNVDAAAHLVEDLLPAVRREFPDLRLRIVGASPGRRVRELHRPPAVTVTGFVPELNQELNRGAVFVAPLRFSAGVQNKVLEAMAAARPVVTTPRVAAGLDATPGRHLLVGERPEELVRHTVGLLGDADRRRSLGASARDFVRDRYSWRVVADRLREIADHRG